MKQLCREKVKLVVTVRDLLKGGEITNKGKILGTIIWVVFERTSLWKGAINRRSSLTVSNFKQTIDSSTSSGCKRPYVTNFIFLHADNDSDTNNNDNKGTIQVAYLSNKCRVQKISERNNNSK